MSPAVASLLALLLVIAVSLFSRLNVGVLAVALAWPIAIAGAGWSADAVMQAFPSSLFLTLLGVSLLFGVSQANGTMQAVTDRAVRLCGDRPAALPPLFFVLACLVSTIGPGAIAATALVAPAAMAVGATAGVPAFVIALMVANGANAGNLSPTSAVGALVQGLMQRIALGGHEWSVWAANFTAHALAGAAAYLLFGGHRPRTNPPGDETRPPARPFETAQSLTILVTAAWIAGVVVFRLPPGLSAFAAASLLVLGGAARDGDVLRRVPWSILVMVSGVSVLVGVLEKTGGMDLFTSLVARITTATTVNGAMAFLTGLVSTYSSTSGVVYPAFLPAVPGLVAKLGGGDPLQVAMSINVGAAMVDVSPLSTIGALCIAAIPAGEDGAALFRKLMVWGLAMTIVGALYAQLLIRVFAR